MKKIVIMLLLVAAITGANAQETSDPDFSIPLLTDTILRYDGSIVTREVSTFPPSFIKDAVIFDFIVKSYNVTNPDTAIFIRQTYGRDTRAVLRKEELAFKLYGKPVAEWIGMLYTPRTTAPSDSTIIRELAKKVYYYKVLGEN